MISPTEPVAQRSATRGITEFLITTVCMLSFASIALFFGVTEVTGSNSGTRDYIVYWATGQQFAHLANPYDATAIYALESNAGFPKEHVAMFMRNPPWALPITLPLALVSSRTGSFFWSLFLLACLLLSVRLLWIRQGRPKGLRAALGYTFAPALTSINTGQTSLLALLGLVLFLYLYRTHPFLAGASLWFCLLKPHMFLPFGVVMLVWVVTSKAYRLLLGALAALGLSVALTYMIDSSAWTQYFAMVRSSGMNNDFIYCLSFMLRNWISPHSTWIEFVPSTLGCVWALIYFWRRRDSWDWGNEGSLVMLVSIVVAPYSWILDQVLAIPALLQGVYGTSSRNLLLSLALASAAVEIAFLGEHWFPSALYIWTLWTAPAWLLWYLAARKFAAHPQAVV
jgi:hypothetical protein